MDADEESILPQETEDESLRTAILARGIKGYHEAEVSFHGEADLHQSLIDCDKNPGHSRFIPAADFSAKDLPDPYRNDPDVVNFIRAQAELTVRVTSTFTSDQRPEGYAFHKYSGKKLLRVGTGFIQYVYYNEGRSTDPCPCPECKATPNPKMDWAKAKVRTATHVVFDKSEALNTVVELFFDKNNEKEKIHHMYGETVRFGAIQGDWCDMRVVTHDLDLCQRLKDTWGRWRWLETKINQKYKDSDIHRLAVVVSHPHGCNKQVSIGRWKERAVIDRCPGWENCVYTYDSPTCPGSSGAPVLLLGRMRLGGFYGRHPHSGRPLGETGLNLSGVGWDKVD